jgi:hypothetical protein
MIPSFIDILGLDTEFIKASYRKYETLIFQSENSIQNNDGPEAPEVIKLQNRI